MEVRQLGTRRVQTVVVTAGNGKNSGTDDRANIVQQPSAEPRRAHPGGAIVTNKAVALAQFLKRKLNQPDGLKSLDLALVEKAVLNAKACIDADVNPCPGKTIRHVTSFSPIESESEIDETPLHHQNPAKVSTKPKAELNGEREAAGEIITKGKEKGNSPGLARENGIPNKLKKKKKKKSSTTQLIDDVGDETEEEKEEKKRKTTATKSQALESEGGGNISKCGDGEESAKTIMNREKNRNMRKRKKERRAEREKKKRAVLEHMSGEALKRDVVPKEEEHKAKKKKRRAKERRRS